MLTVENLAKGQSLKRKGKIGTMLPVGDSTATTSLEVTLAGLSSVERHNLFSFFSFLQKLGNKIHS